MNYTEHTLQIEEKIDALIKAFRSSDVYSAYQTSFLRLNEDEEVRNLKNNFNALRDAFKEQESYLKYRSDVKELQIKMMQAKRKLDCHPKVSDFRQKETCLQDVLDEMTHKIANVFDEGITIDYGNPFTTTQNKKKHHCGRKKH